MAIIIGTYRNDALSGLSGNDGLYGGAGNDLLSGLGGNDVLYGGSGNDLLDGSSGNDLLDGGSGADLMIGGTGDDTYVVDNGADQVIEHINEGRDTIYTSLASFVMPANVEVLKGDGANNHFTGNAGYNVIFGGAGNDVLSGVGGNDELYGGPGIDRLDGGTGADRMIGNAGNDVFIVDNARDRVVEYANEGTDTVLSGIYKYYLPSNVENLVLTAGAVVGIGNDENNAITGTLFADQLGGSHGNDVLYGANGDDRLYGGPGDDILFGGIGADVLWANERYLEIDEDHELEESDRDTFAYNGPAEGGDVILDFFTGVDVLQFAAAAFGFVPGHHLTLGVDLIRSYDPAPTVVRPTFLFDPNKAELSWDADGTGPQAPVLVAIVYGQPTAVDFHLV